MFPSNEHHADNKQRQAAEEGGFTAEAQGEAPNPWVLVPALPQTRPRWRRHLCSHPPRPAPQFPQAKQEEEERPGNASRSTRVWGKRDARKEHVIADLPRDGCTAKQKPR